MNSELKQLEHEKK